MSFTFASVFSGGGLADVGYLAAGGTPLWAIEHDAAIADVYRANIGPHIITASILDVDPATLQSPDLFHASPPCQAHSQARSKTLTARDDADVGLDVLRYVAALLPRCVVIENVIPYRHSSSCQQLTAGLMRLGYMVDVQNVNAANFGIAQTRNRLIIRAVRDGWVPALQPTHGSGTGKPWIGWYEAIADLIPTLPESRFAAWQMARLPEELSTALIDNRNASRDATAVPAERPAFTVQASDFRRPSTVPQAFLHMTGNTNIAQPTGTGILEPAAPANTVVSSSTAARAFICDGQTNDNGDTLTLRTECEPVYTVSASSSKRPARAFILSGTEQRADTMRLDCEPLFTVKAADSNTRYRAWLEQGRVVSMTPRALGRFQSLPDWYALPIKNSLACKVIGNGVPCLLAQRIAESLVPYMEGVEV